MPGVRNKIIINGLGDKGRRQARKAEFETGEYLAEEIEELGLLDHPEAIGFRDEMVKACARWHCADDDYTKFLRDLNQRMFEFIEANRPKATPQP